MGVKLSNEDILEIQGLRDIAMATNFETILAANGLLMGDNNMRLSYKGRFVYSQPLCLLVAPSGFVLTAVELLQAGDCQVNCQHTSYTFCTALVNITRMRGSAIRSVRSQW